MNSLKMGFVLSVVIVIFGGLLVRASDPSVNLQFGSDGKFKIAQFTDMHWEVWQPDSTNQASLDYMARVLDYEQPDLVMLTGDIIPTVYGTMSLWQRTLKVIQERHIPWGVTLGNHDRESQEVSGQSYQQAAERIINSLSSMPYSVVDKGPAIGGAGNYILNIKDSAGTGSAAALYCLDSQRDGLVTSQVQWYQNQSAAITQANGGDPLPSLLFLHIPLYEYKYFDYPPLIDGKIGQKGEKVCNEDTTSAMFNAINASGDVMGVFCGHDHWNDYALFFDNVCLAYGQKTGQNGYGNLPYGGRIIEMTEGVRGFDSWIRVQDGSVLYPFHFGEVPEPSSVVMLLSGFAGLALLARRRAA